MNRTIWLSLALSVATGAAAEAASPTAALPDAPSLVVSAHGLDLSSPAGAAAMLNRLRQAASVVCGGPPSLGDLVAGAAYRGCAQEALDTAIARSDAPLLARVYRGGSAATASLGGAG